MVYEGLNPGDETRRNGDYVGFAHSETDGTAVSNISGPDRGEVVEYDAGSDALVAVTDVTADGGASIAGVLYAYPVYGDSSNAGPYIDGDEDATVKTSGTVIVDFTGVTTDSGGAGGTGIAATDEGRSLGPNGELLVVNVHDAANNLAEVLVR